MPSVAGNQVEQASAKCVQNVARSRISHKVVAKRRKAACKIGKFGQKSARRAQQRREVSAVRIQAVCRKKVARQNVHNARQKRVFVNITSMLHVLQSFHLQMQQWRRTKNLPAFFVYEEGGMRPAGQN
jgi:hypothetical protein